MTQSPTLQQHLSVTSHVTDLTSSISGLFKLHLDQETAPLIESEEGKLLAALASLQLLCAEIRAVNDNTSEQAFDAKLGLVRETMGETQHV